MEPLEVTVVRPKKLDNSDVGAGVVATVAKPFWHGALVMLALGVVPPAPHLGYWPSVLVGIAVHAVTTSNPTGYRVWTKKATS